MQCSVFSSFQFFCCSNEILFYDFLFFCLHNYVSIGVSWGSYLNSPHQIIVLYAAHFYILNSPLSVLVFHSFIFQFPQELFYYIARSRNLFFLMINVSIACDNEQFKNWKTNLIFFFFSLIFHFLYELWICFWDGENSLSLLFSRLFYPYNDRIVL